MEQERLAFVALHAVPGIGNHLFKQLISYCGSAIEVFRRPRGKLLKVPGVGPITADAIAAKTTFRFAERELTKAEKDDVELICFTESRYPSRLRMIEDAPAIIYFRGTCNLNHPKTVGIVGTRQATTYGKHQVEEIIRDLKAHQALIVSGLAYGIDIHAHKQAIRQQLPTIGVLGSGMDIIYPQAHREVALKMMDHGGIMTENTFGTKPDAHNFPSRNRIIAGMCDALIVVEAAESGGALITAEIANSYNKDVFAVPGEIGSIYSEGCNKLIKVNKANLLTSVRDLEYMMNWSAGTTTNSKDPTQTELAAFSAEERQVILAIKAKSASMQIDELSWKTGIPQGVLASLLLNLELKNLVQSMPGKIYRLK